MHFFSPLTPLPLHPYGFCGSCLVLLIVCTCGRRWSNRTEHRPKLDQFNTLSPILTDFSRDGDLIHDRPVSNSQGFLDLTPRTSISYFLATKEISIKTSSHSTVAGWIKQNLVHSHNGIIYLCNKEETSNTYINSS